MSIKFTQFIRPHGDRKCVDFNPDDPEVERLAAELVDAGWSFECEVLVDGTVSFDCCDDETPLAMELTENGPPVVAAVSRLVRGAHEEWVKRERPRAEGKRGEWVKRKAVGYRTFKGVDPDDNPEEFM